MVGIKSGRWGRVTQQQYILGAFVILILLIFTFDAWLGTCGFDGCPTASDIRAFHPDEGGRVLDRDGHFIGRLAIVRRINVPLANVPVAVRQAFIATEDRRFYDHHGIDWRGLFRASFRNLRSMGVREGFSTITMQVVRNTFAVRRYRGRSLRQKLIEMRLSRLLERHLSKDQILEMYLNVIYLGNGVYGVEAASRDLFGKSVQDLNVAEGAMLAALPKGPSAYTPRRSRKKALTRRNLVLSLMADEGYLSQAQATKWQQSPLHVAKDEWRPDQSYDSYAIDAVRQLVDSVLHTGSTDVNDLTVYTTLDMRAQAAADRAVRRRAAAIQSEAIGKGSIEGAMVAIDPQSGDIRALVGGRHYERGNFNRALLAHRQPGSAFKPFVYATALAANYTPATEVLDEPVAVRVGSTMWTPQNYGGEYGGTITFRRALMRSSNAAAVRVSQMVGMPAIIATAHRFGISSDIPNVPASALGAADVTPLELVSAYAPFANGGWRVTPRLVRRLESADGAILWTNDNKRIQVMDPRDAFQLTSMLRSVVDYGTGYEVRAEGVRGMPVAGKTGTTNNGTDVWFVGYTPTVIAGFWFGYDDPQPISYNASGGVLAAPAWADFYSTGWTEPTPAVVWQPPAGMTVVTIDARTGYKANTWCPITQLDYYKPGTEPVHLCPVHAEPPPDTTGGLEQIPQAIESGVKGIGGFFKRLFHGGHSERDTTSREQSQEQTQ